IKLVKDADIAKTKGRHAAEQAEKQAEIYHLDLDHSSKVLRMQEDDSEVQEVVEPSIPDAAPTVVTAYTRRRKGVIIRDLEEELSLKTPAETPKLKDKGKVVTAYTRRRKGVIIRDLEEELSSKTPAETPKLKDKGKGGSDVRRIIQAYEDTLLIQLMSPERLITKLILKQAVIFDVVSY
nr:hypothetical protein [Tanacetum cinerariifolium]